MHSNSIAAYVQFNWKYSFYPIGLLWLYRVGEADGTIPFGIMCRIKRAINICQQNENENKRWLLIQSLVTLTTLPAKLPANICRVRFGL